MSPLKNKPELAKLKLATVGEAEKGAVTLTPLAH